MLSSRCGLACIKLSNKGLGRLVIYCLNFSMRSNSGFDMKGISGVSFSCLIRGIFAATATGTCLSVMAWIITAILLPANTTQKTHSQSFLPNGENRSNFFCSVSAHRLFNAHHFVLNFASFILTCFVFSNLCFQEWPSVQSGSRAGYCRNAKHS